MKSSSYISRALRATGRVSHLLGLALLTSLVTSSPASAQVFGRPLPAPPEITNVPSGTSEATYSVAKTFQLQWNQFFATSNGSVDPSHIVVCIQAPTVTCTWRANAPLNGTWSGSAGASPFVRVGIKSAQGVLLGYRYSLTVALGNLFFDRPLKWTVGACSGTLNSNCTFASASRDSKPVTNYYSTKNIRPDRFSFQFWDSQFGLDLRQVNVSALAGNYGTTDVGPFRSEVIGMTALIDPNNMDLCETNPNRPGLNLRDTALLIDSAGRIWWVANRRSGGTIDTSGLTIVAISVDGPRGLVPGNPSSFDTFLPVGEVEEPVANHVVRVVPATAPIPAQGSRVAVVAISATDFTGFNPWSDPALNNQIVEFNELDNKRVRCSVMIW